MSNELVFVAFPIDILYLHCAIGINRVGHRSPQHFELRKPDKAFIENYDSIVPDIVELANYNIGLQEVGLRRFWEQFGKPIISATTT